MSYGDRLARVRDRMRALGVDVLLCSVGPDLPYLTGYEAMPLERLTMLVVRADDAATLVVPALERPRVHERPETFTTIAWNETEDPVALVASIAGSVGEVAIGDQTWARFVLALQDAMPRARFRPARDVVGPLRAVKDAAEVDALAAAAAAVDRIAAAIAERPFAGRREIDVHRELVQCMLDEGHQRANFAIVAAGENAASPHHEPGERVIRDGELVLCDFGGTMDGYCSDITRMFVVGDVGAEILQAYAVLVDAQEAGVQAATVGTDAAAVDRAAREVIVAAGLGDRFIHRTGHGIGMEAHEDPYVVAGNDEPIVAGNAFSVEPGIYVAGRFGMRLEDIVVATADGPRRLNHARRDLVAVG